MRSVTRVNLLEEPEPVDEKKMIDIASDEAGTSVWFDVLPFQVLTYVATL